MLAVEDLAMDKL